MSGLESRSEPRHKKVLALMAPASEKKRVQEPFFVGSHPPQGVNAMRRRCRWLYRSEPEGTEEALRQTLAELCQALSADRLQQVLRAARYAAEGRSFAVIDLALMGIAALHAPLLPFCQEGGFDLLVIGFMGHSRIFEWVWGSTSQTLTRLAPCSVLVGK